MADVVYENQEYRLRTGGPMPILGGDFVMQTFMAEQTKVHVYVYTQDLPGSEDFRGQGGNYMSASFTRLSDRGGNTFSGKVVYSPTYIDENDIPGYS